MKPPEQIETARLLLRKPNMNDAPDIFYAYASDPQVTRNLTWRPHKNLEDTKAIIQRGLNGWEDGSRYPFMITNRETGQLMGSIEMRMDRHRVELGYVIGRAFGGNGYMTEAVKAIINWALSQPQIYRVFATTSVDNVPSQRVMEKSGMMREGLLRRYIIHPAKGPEPVDSYIYSVVK